MPAARPPASGSDWTRDDFIKALDANMLTPIALMQATLPGMIERGWGRVVNITSGAVKSPIPALGLSNTARTGLTGFVAGTSRQVAGKGVTINNLLPASTRPTAPSRSIPASRRPRASISRPPAGSARRRSPRGRYGTAEEFGAACAFLCSVHAGFIVGQNWLLDGGGINSTLLRPGFPMPVA